MYGELELVFRITMDRILIDKGGMRSKGRRVS